TTTDALNEILQAAQTRYMGFSDLPLVSSDYREESRSGVVDGLSTRVIDTTVKVLIWYNNEWAYAHRVLDLIHHMQTMEI
ncbi:MAG: type I glyceraldehyde-3-phosphate dehydrogenase, partial [Magnetococcales bacterium]|nr:type I glyceraldehyde-3-phosphate dehydrogenase [Magnetococcales bacterium]